MNDNTEMISLFPDPDYDTLTIESADIITEVVIINSIGTEFPVDCREQTDRSMVLNTSKLSNGMYLIGLSTKSTWVMKKIVINR